MVKRQSKHTKVTYALIVASLVAIAFGMFRFREGFQVDFTGKKYIGIRVSSSDASLSETIKSDPGNFSSGFRMVDVASGKNVFYVRNAVGTLDADNILTNDTTIKMYDVFIGSDLPVPGDSKVIDSQINTKMIPDMANSPVITNIILKDSTGAISYYPELSASSPALAPTTSTTATTAPAVIQAVKTDNLTSLQIGAIVGGSIVGVIVIGGVIVKLAS